MMKAFDLWGDEEPMNSLCFASGPIIVGAGPSGLAVAASLRLLNIPSLILERSDGIASLWRHHTYDRIHLHLPKTFCELPHLPIPPHFPTYLSAAQFVDYLTAYANHFNLRPRFNERVTSARFDDRIGLWRVQTSRRRIRQASRLFNIDNNNNNNTLATTPTNASNKKKNQNLDECPPDLEDEVREYAGHWLIVASGENAEAVLPPLTNLHKFNGNVCHSQHYKNARGYEGQKVLVVGCGNSGMEIALDLIKSGAFPSLVVRNAVHVLPQEILGESTFAIILKLVKIFPVWIADCILLFAAWCKWQNTAKCGLPRPKEGPIAYKNRRRRTPVLDIGTLCLVKSGHIKVFPAIKTFTPEGAQFSNGQSDKFDSIILATGYRSNVKDWLIGQDDHFTPDGFPSSQGCIGGWKGRNGLYVVGMSGKGLAGTKSDAQLIAKDIQLEF